MEELELTVRGYHDALRTAVTRVEGYTRHTKHGSSVRVSGYIRHSLSPSVLKRVKQELSHGQQAEGYGYSYDAGKDARKEMHADLLRERIAQRARARDVAIKQLLAEPLNSFAAQNIAFTIISHQGYIDGAMAAKPLLARNKSFSDFVQSMLYAGLPTALSVEASDEVALSDVWDRIMSKTKEPKKANLKLDMEGAAAAMLKAREVYTQTLRSKNATLADRQKALYLLHKAMGRMAELKVSEYTRRSPSGAPVRVRGYSRKVELVKASQELLELADVRVRAHNRVTEHGVTHVRSYFRKVLPKFLHVGAIVLDSFGKEQSVTRVEGNIVHYKSGGQGTGPHRLVSETPRISEQAKEMAGNAMQAAQAADLLRRLAKREDARKSIPA